MMIVLVSLAVVGGVLLAVRSRVATPRPPIPEQRRVTVEVPPSAEVQAWAAQRDGDYPGWWRVFRHLSSPAAPHAGPDRR